MRNVRDAQVSVIGSMNEMLAERAKHGLVTFMLNWSENRLMHATFYRFVHGKLVKLQMSVKKILRNRREIKEKIFSKLDMVRQKIIETNPKKAKK